MANFDLSQYQTVAERIDLFWKKYPNGRIHTDIFHLTELGGIFKAEIYTDREDTRPAAVDFAEEVKGSSPVNRTSWVENGTTSAIGRALADLGFSPKADKGGKRASREEMAKVQRLNAERDVAIDWGKRIGALNTKADARKLYGEAKATADATVLAMITEAANLLPDQA